MQRGLLPPCQVSRGVYRAWLAKPHIYKRMWLCHMQFQGFRIVSGRYPEYHSTETRDAKAMPDKQDRYRERKTEQGFRRVEVIVPEELISHLKAYARALRDTHALGALPPLFDGMGSRSQNILLPVEKNIQTTAEEIEQTNQDHPDPSPSRTAQTRKIVRPTKPKPDFSGGLLDKPSQSDRE